ncbi:FAD-dependent monooxygenase [Millisia brevis]|uniref:FAD-dependent monooxygenase n=1 Tax=Millisia brevis TaxID=264148 RepID=UPI00082FD052|nr:FAD-dependent monooxygenase [Millisia brevis]
MNTSAGVGGDHSVLIVGSGPVGLTIACDLRRQGVSVRVVERNAEAGYTDPHSRAILIIPRSLEVLGRIGVVSELIKLGNRVPIIEYYSDGKRLGTARFNRMSDSAFPFVLSIPQRLTEAVLRRRFEELGGTVEYNTEVVEVEPGPGGFSPLVTLRSGDGAVTRFAPGWLVGADGAGSKVRSAIGEKLLGDATDVTYLIADARIDGMDAQRARYCYSKDGVLTIIPMPEGYFRVAANIPHLNGASDDADWQNVLQGCVDRRMGPGLVVGDLRYVRAVRPSCGRVGRMQFGRCFLAGDAAHVVSPAGGQGLNLGFQDAINLGWRLAGVISGVLPESKLEEYGPERTQAARRTSMVAATIIRFAQTRGTVRRMARDVGFLVADKVGLVQRFLVPSLSQTDVRYPMPHSSHRLVGRRLPDPSMAGGTGGCTATDSYSVAVWNFDRAAEKYSGDVSGRFRDAIPEGAPVVEIPSTRGTRRAVNGWFHQGAPVAALVRPDGHVERVARLSRRG